MKFIHFILLAIVTITISGCVYRTDHSKDYLQAKSIQPVTIPEDLTAKKIKTYYPVTAKNSSGKSTSVSLIPPGSQIRAN